MGLFKPAWMSKNETKAITAVGRITDQAELARAAREAYCGKARRLAAELCNDLPVLAEEVSSESNDKRFYPRNIDAITRINDEQLLKKIVLYKFEKKSNAYTALCKITDPQVLHEIECQSQDKYIRNLAVRFAAFREDDGLVFGAKLRSAQINELGIIFTESPILYPFSSDIDTVMRRNHFKWSENGHSYLGGDPAPFRASANRLISLAQEQPKYLVPIWDRLTKQINEATDSRETWQWNGEYETINTYDDGPRTIREKELVTSTNGMGLQFPELPDEFRAS